MFAPSIPPMKPGDPIRASWLERLRKAALQALNLAVEAPLDLVPVAGGFVLRLVWNPEFWVRIGARTGSAYAWQGLVPGPSGTWLDSPKSGTAALDPAYEASGSTAAVAGKVALARRALGTGVVIFQRGTCT